MTSSNNARFVRSRILIPVLWVIFLTACNTTPFYKKHDDLKDAVQYYNDYFEGKLLDRSAVLVHRDQREDFMIRSPEILNRVTFLETSVINMRLLNNGAPVPVDAGFFDKGKFNEAIVIIRYQLVVSPSNTVKTMVVNQRWVLEGDQWVVYPDLDVFLNPK
ncbi:hypothetical protein UR09_04930 [Candidatus Nitromaritima sp. SCGC AAA799-A02]|nr:hypothetical protein UZ36_07375 [Candidatus Nitromaritima sp. SCGC AAA799-C22]KMP10881.1 hypothetical protein UR09_04930 [Candidatus Nitromaritima sp. SCGC AAA799-A02]